VNPSTGSGQATWTDAAAVPSLSLLLAPHALHQSLIVGLLNADIQKYQGKKYG